MSNIRRSKLRFLGLPLLDIAIDADPAAVEVRGRACGIAIGDTAIGVVAIGNIACALAAVGGGAIGVICFGGCASAYSLRLGASPSAVTTGGAVGWYACGGCAAGRYIIGSKRRDPEAVEAFRRCGITVR